MKPKEKIKPMDKGSNPIYDKNTLEFVTVAFEFCSWIESSYEHDLMRFVDKTIKLLPLLYLKATLLPATETDDESEMTHFITEETYDTLRNRLAALLGEYDSYLETFATDMQYSDTPVAAFISENLADLYQDIGNFVSLFRQGYDKTMRLALATCIENFRLYWGQSLLNALKALHAIRYNEDINMTGDTQ